MKSKLLVPVILLVVLLLSSVSATSQNSTGSVNVKTTLLFNGKNLNNWIFKLKDPKVNPAEVFSVKDGVIRVKGDPFGYMRTKEVYSDYLLHVEWRWPGEATNSGVFVHAQHPDTIFPKCFECQLQAGNAGDFICANGSDMNERVDKSNKKIKKTGPSSEKLAGEWNIMEIICEGNTIEVYVNGDLKNKGTGLSLSGGYICLQSEGKLVEFRNVWLRQEKK